MAFMYNICVSVCVKKEFFIFPLEIISLRCLFFEKRYRWSVCATSIVTFATNIVTTNKPLTVKTSVN